MSRPARRTRSQVQDTEWNGTEVHGPSIVIDGFETDQFASSAERQVPLRALKRDDAVGIRTLDAEVPRVFRF